MNLLLSILVTLALTLSCFPDVDCRRRGSKARNAGFNLDLNKDIKDSNREGKLFSLFSIVTFDNKDCVTTSSIKGGTTPFRNGTCFTQSECEERKGTANGGCAAGFGVCCLFATSKSGDTVVQNNTYVRNPGFPRDLNDAEDVSYQVNRVSDSICSLRLDFERFVMSGPTDTEETDGGMCTDTFNVDGASDGLNIPQICGTNTGQHIYVDVGPGQSGGEAARFSFEFAANADGDDVEWEIKVAQIECGSALSAPSGCLQYTTGTSGRFKTFNFDGDIYQHLKNQRYSSCMRQEAGFCCMQYTVCPDETLAFSLDVFQPAGSEINHTEETCKDVSTRTGATQTVFRDYIRIEGASNMCTDLPMKHVNKFCGDFFTTLDTAGGTVKDHEIICDCSSPFAVDVHTNEFPDAATINTRNSRGVCLDWMQVPC